MASAPAFLGGVTYDRAGSYNLALIGAALTLVAAVVPVNRLGGYVYPADRRLEPDLAPEPAAS